MIVARVGGVGLEILNHKGHKAHEERGNHQKFLVCFVFFVVKYPPRFAGLKLEEDSKISPGNQDLAGGLGGPAGSKLSADYRSG